MSEYVPVLTVLNKRSGQQLYRIIFLIKNGYVQGAFTHLLLFW